MRLVNEVPATHFPQQRQGKDDPPDPADSEALALSTYVFLFVSWCVL